MNTNQTKTEIGIENPTPHVVPSRTCADGSSTGGSGIIPQHILDHAEKHYPAASRPKCPIFARNWDREKQHCIDNRLKIEAEQAAKYRAQTEPTPPMRTPAPTQKSNSPQSQISNLKSQIPTPSHLQSAPKPPDFPPSPASSRQNFPKNIPQPTAPKKSQNPNAQFSILDSQFSMNTNPKLPPDPQVTPVPQVPPSPTPTLTLTLNPNLNPTLPPPTINPTLTLARVLQSAAHRKSRPDDKIAALSDDDRQQLLDWLNHMSYDAVVQLVAQPRPQGLDLKTSRPALQRFYAKHDLNDRLQSAIDILEAAAPTPGVPNPLEQTLELLVHAQATRTASQPITDRALPHFLRHITRLRELQLRDRATTLRQKRLAFQMQTEGYDLVAETMKKLPELNEIAANKNITPRQAMEKGFRKVFGDQTADYIQETNQKYAEQYPNEPDYDPAPEIPNTEPELTDTEVFRLMLEFPDTPMPEIRAIAAQRRANGQPITANPDDLNIV